MIDLQQTLILKEKLLSADKSPKLKRNFLSVDKSQN